MSRVVDEHASRWSRNSGSQFQQSTGLELRITLTFRLRPAGWVGNDGHCVATHMHFFVKYILPLLRRELMGDERIEYAAQWRRRVRGRHTAWQPFAEIKR